MSKTQQMVALETRLKENAIRYARVKLFKRELTDEGWLRLDDALCEQQAKVYLDLMTDIAQEMLVVSTLEDEAPTKPPR